MSRRERCSGRWRAMHPWSRLWPGRKLASSSSDMTIRIWDVEMGALHRTLEIGISPSALSFSPNKCDLITDLGCFSLDQSSPPNWSGYCLHADRSWITLNGRKLLWLPQEYRPWSSIVTKQTVAIGCVSGRILFISLKEN